MLLPHAVELPLDDVIGTFATQGYARLGQVFSPEAVAALARRGGALTSSETPVKGMFYQHDSPSGDYADLDFGAGWVGPSSRYRKVERLELDGEFRAFIENRLFGRLCSALLEPPIRLYRSVLWNKAPRVGMAVPWHQDDGRFWGLSSAPFLQVWTALDDAPVESGCLQVVPGSHLGGLATSEGGTIPDTCFDALTEVVTLPAKRGESILVHNHTWHRTGRNTTASPRRAISVSFLGGDVVCRRRRRAPRQFLRLFEDQG